ncbi:GlsB/YeaQ/YmgE family stress response membrane protein [Corynebacterium sp. LaCa78]|uniref:GlsB/YeaQ/YmgE family stress response membrane protein n=1 Tax=Corynebacterium sp. LaCa78 TaxID=3391430 RepID=UPI003989BAA6
MGLGLGLFTSIIVGIIAGWLAEKIMKRDHGLFTNLVVGVIGGIIIQLLNIEASGGWIFSIVAATAGACILLWIVDKVKQ